MSPTVQNVENFRCFIFVTKGIQALSKSILKLCDKRMYSFVISVQVVLIKA
jgi:hypothetical protein